MTLLLVVERRYKQTVRRVMSGETPAGRSLVGRVACASCTLSVTALLPVVDGAA